MRNIWRIIKADARSLFTHFFALAVALVIAVLPAGVPQPLRWR